METVESFVPLYDALIFVARTSPSRPNPTSRRDK